MSDPTLGGKLSNWAVQYVGRPRSGMVHRAHAGLPAIAITSITTTPWTDDIGDLVALVLGYCFTTTRELVRELVADPYTAQSLRADIHDNFLCTATPLQRVWTHHGAALTGTNDHAPFRDSAGRATPGLFQVFLVEDDAALRHSAEFPPGTTRERTATEIDADEARFRETRDLIVQRAAQAAPEDAIHTIDVAVPRQP